MRQSERLYLSLANLVLLSAVLLPAATPARAGQFEQRLSSEAIVFPEVTGSRASNADVDRDIDVVPAASVFVTAKLATARFLAEYFVNEDEQELERVQIGWQLGDELVAWIGRFHNPIGYWNTTFHHGSFLQTSVSRPAIVKFEDEGGVLPMHVSGLLLQGEHAVRRASLFYEIGVGVGPEFSDDALEPLDLLEPSGGSHRFTTAAKIAFRVDELVEDEVAAFAAYADIPGAGSSPDIEQSLGGAYLLWTPGPFRVLAVGFYVDDGADGKTGVSDDAFVSGYVHGELRALEDVTAYARVEASDGVSGDDYLELFPEIVRGRTVGGLRLEMSDRQAVKFEFGHTRRTGANGEEFLVQWSAAFP